MKDTGRTAIIGGGAAGLVALKFAREDGLEAELFEGSADTGGQWSRFPGRSGIWDSLQTNSSKYLTCFSDLDHEPGTAIYPGHKVIKGYLDRYRDRFYLKDYIHLDTPVLSVGRAAGGGYWLEVGRGAAQRKEHFARVIIASGRFNKPYIPSVAFLSGFKGQLSHACDYRNSADFAGKTVLVIGSRVTGTEVAADLSQNDSVTVVSSCRNPKYIVRKTIDGEPVDHHLFTRHRAQTANALSPEMRALRLKEFVLTHFGNPASFGALPPSEDLREAGVTVTDDYLDRIDKGRIIPKPQVSRFTGDGVEFVDGSRMQVHHVIFATGYDLHLPFLSEDLLATLAADNDQPNLYKYTFHPDLPGMAFIGFYRQVGAFFPSLELQARWINGCWSGGIAEPDGSEMKAWLDEFKTTKHLRALPMAHDMITLFAKAAGFEPDPDSYPDLADDLLFGPLLPSQFRMQGHGKWPGAEERYRRILIELRSRNNSHSS